MQTNDIEKRIKKLENYRKEHIDNRPQYITLLNDDGSVFWESKIHWTKWQR